MNDVAWWDSFKTQDRAVRVLWGQMRSVLQLSSRDIQFTKEGIRAVLDMERLPEAWQKALVLAKKYRDQSKNETLHVGAVWLDDDGNMFGSQNYGKDGHAEQVSLADYYRATIPNGKNPKPTLLALAGKDPHDQPQKEQSFSKDIRESEVHNHTVLCCPKCLEAMVDKVAQVPDFMIATLCDNGQVYLYTRRSAAPVLHISRNVPADWYMKAHSK